MRANSNLAISSTADGATCPRSTPKAIASATQSERNRSKRPVGVVPATLTGRGEAFDRHLKDSAASPELSWIGQHPVERSVSMG